MKNVSLSIMFILLACAAATSQSDEKAIQIADEVIEAMGGKKSWDNSHYIAWNFFGRRQWLWDKWSGNVRCDYTDGSKRIAMNIHTMEGQVYVHGQLQTEQDSLDKYLKQGYELWINDSYWLCMPFKLRDPGVTLEYLGHKPDMDNEDCNVIQLTFENVGVTPNNKYHVYVSPETSFVTQWDFFRNYNDDKPAFSSPWEDYQQYGEIMLSSKRGDRGMGEIAVYDNVPEIVFQDAARPVAELLK